MRSGRLHVSKWRHLHLTGDTGFILHSKPTGNKVLLRGALSERDSATVKRLVRTAETTAGQCMIWRGFEDLNHPRRRNELVTVTWGGVLNGRQFDARGHLNQKNTTVLVEWLVRKSGVYILQKWVQRLL